MMNYPYLLLSNRDGKFSTGSTIDLRKRLRQHAAGSVRSTAYRLPLVLAYYEACLNIADARRRERFLKTGKGKRYLNNRLAGYLSQVRRNGLERH